MPFRADICQRRAPHEIHGNLEGPRGELQKGDARKDFYWNGSDCDIQRLYHELKNNIENWELKAINYKTEPQTNR